MKVTYAAAMLLSVLAVPAIWAAAEDSREQAKFECSCEAKSGKASRDWSAPARLDAKQNGLNAQQPDAGLHQPASSADSSEDQLSGRMAGGEGNAKDAGKRLEELLNTADMDRNGEFDSHERSTLVASLVSCRLEKAQELIGQFDADKDKNLSAEERGAASKAISAAYEQHMDSMLKEFDADKDGKLSAAERKAAQHPDLACSCQFKGGENTPVDTSTDSSSNLDKPATY